MSVRKIKHRILFSSITAFFLSIAVILIEGIFSSDHSRFIVLLSPWLGFIILTIFPAMFLLCLPLYRLGSQFHREKKWTILVGVYLLPLVALFLVSIGFAATRELKLTCGLEPYNQFTEMISSHSIEFTEEKLSHDHLINPLLTHARLKGMEVAFADYSLGIASCSSGVNIRWKNSLQESITLSGLPKKSPIILSPGKSHTERFTKPQAYLYTWNEHPGIIHVGSATRKGERNLKAEQEFCDQYARHEIAVTTENMNSEEAEQFLQPAGLTITQRDPYGVYTIRVPKEMSVSEVHQVLSDEPRIRFIQFECTFDDE